MRNNNTFNKRFSLLLAGAVLIGMLAVTPRVFAALEGEISQLKIFTRNSSTIESAVNDWLASQKNIVVDQIKANAYGGDYAVMISYRASNYGSVSTRIKIFDSNALTGSVEDNGTTPEMRAQELISSLSSAHIIRSADIFVASGPWDIFIVYDENPVQSVILEVQNTPVVETIKSFIENIINPIAPTEEPAATTTAEIPDDVDTSTTTPAETPADTDASTTTTDISPAPTIETPVAPTEEQTEKQGEALGVFTSLLAASIFNAGDFFFNNQIGGVVFLLLLLALIYFVSELLRKWRNKD